MVGQEDWGEPPVNRAFVFRRPSGGGEAGGRQHTFNPCAGLRKSNDHRDLRRSHAALDDAFTDRVALLRPPSGQAQRAASLHSPSSSPRPAPWHPRDRGAG